MQLKGLYKRIYEVEHFIQGRLDVNDNSIVIVAHSPGITSKQAEQYMVAAFLGQFSFGTEDAEPIISLRQYDDRTFVLAHVYPAPFPDRGIFAEYHCYILPDELIRYSKGNILSLVDQLCDNNATRYSEQTPNLPPKKYSSEYFSDDEQSIILGKAQALIPHAESVLSESLSQLLQFGAVDINYQNLPLDSQLLAIQSLILLIPFSFRWQYATFLTHPRSLKQKASIQPVSRNFRDFAIRLNTSEPAQEGERHLYARLLHEVWGENPDNPDRVIDSIRSADRSLRQNFQPNLAFEESLKQLSCRTLMKRQIKTQTVELDIFLENYRTDYLFDPNDGRRAFELLVRDIQAKDLEKQIEMFATILNEVRDEFIQSSIHDIIYNIIYNDIDKLQPEDLETIYRSSKKYSGILGNIVDQTGHRILETVLLTENLTQYYDTVSAQLELLKISHNIIAQYSSEKYIGGFEAQIVKETLLNSVNPKDKKLIREHYKTLYDELVKFIEDNSKENRKGENPTNLRTFIKWISEIIK